MSLTVKNLEKQLARGKISPLYCLMGSETFLIRESLRLIKSYILSDTALDFNYAVFDMGKTSGTQVREAVETLPVFSDKRVIVCEKAWQIKEQDLKHLEPVLTKPVNSCVLIFVVDKIDKRHSITKKLLSFSAEISVETPAEKQWPVWIEWMGQRKGLRLTAPAIALLKQYTGHNLISLENEIKKLSQFLGNKKTVSHEDVLNIVPRTRPENIFALSQAVGQRNISQALVCLHRLLEDNQNEIGALALITRHIRILIRVKEGMSQKINPQYISEQTGVPSFFMPKYIKEARLWSREALLFAMDKLQETDKTIKLTTVPSSMWLENFIIKVCSY